MAVAGIKGEKICARCECLFVNNENGSATLCKACERLGPENAGPNEKFIYQDVKRSDIETKLTQCLNKLDAILKLLKANEPKAEYSRKCDTCGQVFVTDAPNAKYCESCKTAAN